MAESFHFRRVTKSRKTYLCSWCGQSISPGESYCSYGWRDGDSGGYERLHAECYEAMTEAAHEDGGFLLWSPGDFQRGCCCHAGHCECKEAKDGSQYTVD